MFVIEKTYFSNLLKHTLFDTTRDSKDNVTDANHRVIFGDIGSTMLLAF